MRNADNLPPYRAVVMKSGSLNFLEPFWACTGLLWENFTLFTFITHIIQFVCVAVILRYLGFIAYWNYLVAIFKFTTVVCIVLKKNDY